MLFNSYIYIFLFLPAVILLYYVLNKLQNPRLCIGFLTLASLVFYSYWNINFTPILLSSIVGNYIIGYLIIRSLAKKSNSSAKFQLILGISLNLMLLFYFKYANFVMENLNQFFNFHSALEKIDLPLGISFFTFTQIAFLVDTYKSKAKEYSFINYCLFVSYFPHLIAGPILHHSEMMPQFEQLKAGTINWKNIYLGLVIFSIGLFKKAIIADTFANWANAGYTNTETLKFFSSWICSLAYTFQLYYDFSGYSDMAIGSAMLFNIKLPFNFNSPYKALSIQDFWQRWHMTLSRWLRDYIYIPLGGNRLGNLRTYLNLMLTFLLGGIWHGAGWTFILWGFFHGSALVIHRMWQKLDIAMPTVLAWLITFSFVNFAWVLFRAPTLHDALNVYQAMFLLHGLDLPESMSQLIAAQSWLPTLNADRTLLFSLITFSLMAFFAKNSQQLAEVISTSYRSAFYYSIIAAIGISGLTRITQFLYFQF